MNDLSNAQIIQPPVPPPPALHVECTLGLGCLLFGAVANQSSALGQAEVKGQQGSVLHADGPQSGTVDLQTYTRIYHSRV